MKALSWLFMVLIFSGAAHTASAIDADLQFASPDDELRYQRLVEELRCLVCQNQNLAESNAGLAKDLRQRTYEMIKSGQSDEQILDYMVERYGDFVLYRPPFKPLTIVLWTAPAVFLLLVAGSFWLYSRRRKSKSVDSLSSDERRQAQSLLDD